MKRFETELPEGYREVYCIDAKDKKTGLILNGAALILFLIALVPFALTFDYSRLPELVHPRSNLLLMYAIFFGGMLLYIVLHELVHGAAYKILTKQKLTFGITWSAAFCGVPQIYCYRTVMLISILAPFTVFTIVFLPLALAFANNTPVYLGLVLLFCAHISGCVGDLYGTSIMLFRYRNSDMLANDTGPKQTFYLPAEKTE